MGVVYITDIILSTLRRKNFTLNFVHNSCFVVWIYYTGTSRYFGWKEDDMRYFVIRQIKGKKPLRIVMSGDRLAAEAALNDFVNQSILEIVEVAVIGDGVRHSGKETI